MLETSTDPRIGIVGCGTIGKTHATAYKQNSVVPVAVADANPEAATRLGADIGARVYNDYNEMLAEERLDAISVCTPPNLHHEITLAALKAGVSVLCEKPMATTIRECEEMAATSEAMGKLLTAGFCHRFEPAIEKMSEMVRSGTLGTVMMFRNRFAGHMANAESRWFSDPEVSGGGVMFDTCIHSVDIFRYLVGEPETVKAVAATTETELGPSLLVEDTAIISIRAVSGALGVIEASWRTPPGEWTVTLYGTSGTVTYDYDRNELRAWLDGEWKQVEFESGSRFTREIAGFLACLDGTEQPRVTARDGIEATRMLAEAYRSSGFVQAEEASRA